MKNCCVHLKENTFIPFLILLIGTKMMLLFSFPLIVVVNLTVAVLLGLYPQMEDKEGNWACCHLITQQLQALPVPADCNYYLSDFFLSHRKNSVCVCVCECLWIIRLCRKSLWVAALPIKILVLSVSALSYLCPTYRNLSSSPKHWVQKWFIFPGNLLFCLQHKFCETALTLTRV